MQFPCLLKSIIFFPGLMWDVRPWGGTTEDIRMLRLKRSWTCVMAPSSIPAFVYVAVNFSVGVITDTHPQ